MNSIIENIKQIDHRPSWNDYFITMAYLISKRSSCERLNVGCIVTKDNRIVTTGYNGHLPNAPHVSVVRNDHEQMTIHAECNAVADSAKRGVSLQNCIAYITHMPCLMCAKMLIASGITHIIFCEIYKTDDLVYEMCKLGHVQLSNYNSENGNINDIITENDFIQKQQTTKINSLIKFFEKI